MEKRSWFQQNAFFYTLLALVFLLHILLIATRMTKNFDLVQTPPEQSVNGPPVKMKILSESDYKNIVRKQIVESEGMKSSHSDNRSRFLSDKNRVFDRQTIAKKIDRFNRAGKSSDNSKKSLSLSDLAPFAKSHDPLLAAAKHKHQASKNTGVKNGDPDSRGESSSSDYVTDVPLGDMTYLNTTEYKYYGFYHRIRQKLEQFWGRSVQETAASLAKDGRRVASSDNLITSLEVTLNDIGEVVAIAIKGASGVKELDDAAIESFNEAGPFPNPPKGLIENGLVKVEWGFVVQTSRTIL